MIRNDRFAKVEVRDTDGLWRWLAQHHEQSEPVWLVTWLKRPGAVFLSREQVLDALIAWGWIDGIRRAEGYAKAGDAENGPGAGRTMQLISPRRHQRWTASYRTRAARLQAEGRMQPPGQAAIDRARADGTWEADPDVDALKIPPDLQAALATAGAAAAQFDAFPPSHRRNVLRWIAGAKTAPTRSKRISTLVDLARGGKRVPNF